MSPLGAARVSARLANYAPPRILLRVMAGFTPSQVSDMLGIPPSTLRRYVADFGDHLSAKANRPRGRRYSDQDIATLKKARELLNQRQPVDQVNRLLGIIDDPEATPSDSLALVPDISTALTTALEAARGLRIEVDDLAERQDQADDRLDALTEWVAIPWYRRIGQSPPLAPPNNRKAQNPG